VSGIVHPASSFTAAVQDIEDGLVDMAVGPFWVTSQRLQMASFSLPFSYDKTYLVIPKPGTKDTLMDQVNKVLAPFSYGLWGLVLGVIAVAALLSVWFTDRSPSQSNNTDARMRSMYRNRHQNGRIGMKLYSRLALDQCLEKGLVSTIFFSAESSSRIEISFDLDHYYCMLRVISSFAVPELSKM